MPAERPVVAAFDVDGTLTTRDCVAPFVLSVTRHRALVALLRSPAATLRAVVRWDRDALKELVCRAFAGLDAGAVDAAGARFADEVLRTRMREDTVARLERHRARGDRVVLASASLGAYLHPLGEQLGVDGVVCTELERDRTGSLSGRLAGPNCRGAEKARRFRAWLDSEGIGDAVVWAYGDSAGDTELLALADHPVWVRRARVEPGLATPGDPVASD